MKSKKQVSMDVIRQYKNEYKNVKEKKPNYSLKEYLENNGYELHIGNLTLTKEDLPPVGLIGDLNKLNFSKTTFEGITINPSHTNSSQGQEDIVQNRIRFVNCTFTNVQFTGEFKEPEMDGTAGFSKCSFKEGCEFKKFKLINTRFEGCKADTLKFEDGTITRIRIDESTINQENPPYYNVNFENCEGRGEFQLREREVVSPERQTMFKIKKSKTSRLPDVKLQPQTDSYGHGYYDEPKEEPTPGEGALTGGILSFVFTALVFGVAGIALSVMIFPPAWLVVAIPAIAFIAVAGGSYIGMSIYQSIADEGPSVSSSSSGKDSPGEALSFRDLVPHDKVNELNNQMAQALHAPNSFRAEDKSVQSL